MSCCSNLKTTTKREIEEEEVGVFIDTSLGTHIAISVSPHITASQFIRKFESMHSNCYPQIGSIKVSGLMVKRKSCLYHLAESIPLSSWCSK
uniref:uncharacterized protein LOC122593164 isoform X2 n=1 Tax=Erigeron canadensis TaxID=72917 RepID=UPI001CB971B0|nr:uncharacterized protein LOC122593164 isoform X2 [Erigeron canadensis]